ncbi:MAG: hypothetical protein JRI61_05065 [Deltaproteobacteria bacterium]|nr:hypothetical protein [Deltaproteobacteria bacterium]
MKADESLQKLPDASIGQPEAYSEPEKMEKSAEESDARDLKAEIQKKETSGKDKAAPK